MSLLEVKNLRTYFNTEAGVARAVDGISFALEEGESLALVGESACGKSVTALSIMRLIEPPSGYHPSGSIRFEGTDLLHIRLGPRRQTQVLGLQALHQRVLRLLGPAYSQFYFFSP